MSRMNTFMNGMRNASRVINALDDLITIYQTFKSNHPSQAQRFEDTLRRVKDHFKDNWGYYGAGIGTAGLAYAYVRYKR
jgi:ATP-dependent helicase/DNAse subunit B